LAFAEYGDPGGLAVLFFHGFPGSRLKATLLDEAALAEGIRLIAVDRPGFGRTPQSPSSSLRDWARQIEAFADELALRRFAVVGHSGGSPYALACARYLGDRISIAGVVAGLPPMALGASRGMPWPNRLSFLLARLAPPLVDAVLRSTARAANETPDRFLASWREDLATPDLPIFDRPEVQALLLKDVQEGFRQGIAGPAAELRTVVRPWGFTLTEIETSVQVWLGELDRTIPPSVWRTPIHRLRNVEVHVVPGLGHTSLLVREGRAILRSLTGASTAIED
jgi:pimeloyl-ACP methyl ester carboxylesterase